MTALPPPPAEDAPARVRWGLGDFVIALFGGVAAAIVVQAVEVGIRYGSDAPKDFDIFDNLVSGVGQFAAWFGLVWLLLTLRRRRLTDVGLRADFEWWWTYLVGFFGAFVLGTLSLPLDHLWKDAGHGTQQVGQDLQDAAGGTRIGMLLMIVLLAPFVEEVLFRGLLLRGLARRIPPVTAVLVCGTIFALVHTLDPDTLPGVPTLFVVGVVSSILAIRSGNLTASILLHMGFNTAGALSLLATGVVPHVHW